MYDEKEPTFESGDCFLAIQNWFLEKIVGLEMVSWNDLLAVDHGDHQGWGRFFLGHARVEHSPEGSWVVGDRDL